MAGYGFTTGQYRTPQWVNARHGQVPAYAVQGGNDSGPLYVGRAFHDGELIPGKVQPTHGGCYISYAGKEVKKDDYEVLCNASQCQLQWVSSSHGNVPAGALQGGKTTSGEPLYIGRANHSGSQTIGKVHPSHRCLYIPYGCSEHSHSSYEVLVCHSMSLF